MKHRKIAFVSLVLALAVLCSGWACQQTKSAAVAANRYANALSDFQDAEITAHKDGKVDDATHVKIQSALKAAAEAGSNLDKAIEIAQNGGDPTQYVDLAVTTFNELDAVVQPTGNQGLATLSAALGDLLKNAVTLIQAIHGASVPAPAKPSGGLALWLTLGGLGVFGMAIDLNGIIGLLTLITQLEPEAFDLIVKLATSLKGQTTEQVLALNEQLFGKVQQTADAEIAATQGKQGQGPSK